MSADIIQFIPRSNPDRSEALAVRAAYNQMAVEIMSIAILDGDSILENDSAPAEYNYQAPTDDPA
jgi:hypothetical protein